MIRSSITLPDIDEALEDQDRYWQAYCATAKTLDRDSLYDELIEALRDGSRTDPLEELLDTLTAEPEYDATRPSYCPAGLVERLGRLVYRRACEVVDRMTTEAIARSSDANF